MEKTWQGSTLLFKSWPFICSSPWGMSDGATQRHPSALSCSFEKRGVDQSSTSHDEPKKSTTGTDFPQELLTAHEPLLNSQELRGEREKWMNPLNGQRTLSLPFCSFLLVCRALEGQPMGQREVGG
jgi:hypothetical protein